MPRKTHTYVNTHKIRGRRLVFDLTAEDAALRQRASRGKAGRAGKTLVKEGSLRLMLTALRKGAALAQHRVAGPASIEVIRGALTVSTPEGDTVLKRGGLMVLGPGVRHAATASSDCAALIAVIAR